MTAAFALAMALVLVAAGAFVYLRVSSDLDSSLNETLRARAGDLSTMVRDADGRPRLDGFSLGDPEEGFAQILSADGQILDSSLPAGTPSPLTAAELPAAGESPAIVGDRPVESIEGAARIVVRPVAVSGETLVVTVGVSTQDRSETLAGLAGAFAIGGPLAMLIASGLGYLLAAAGLAPVEAMRRRAGEITLERSGERLPLPAADDEIHRLGETLNEMLARLESSIERERRFVSDASHELRTPLAVLRAELELGLDSRRTPEEMRAALASAVEEADRLSQLAEDLLVIARTDRGSLPISTERVDVEELFERSRDRWSGRLAEAGRELRTEVPAGLEATLDPLRIEQALGNLIDNSLRYGAGEIVLRAAAANGGGIEIEVADAGPGFPAEFVADAFERFSRAEQGRTAGGTGLGLAIARAIAEAHRGTIAIDAEAPGAVVRIVIPAAAPSPEREACY